MNESASGAALVAAAAVAWSSAGYFTRLIPVALFAMLVWRNVFGGLFMTAYVFATEPAAGRQELPRARRRGLARRARQRPEHRSCYLAALRHTSVANVAVIYATAPFGAAAIAWSAYRDRASIRTLLAGLLALAGVAITVGGTSPGRGLTGDLLAVGMMIGLATFTVVLRHHRRASMLPAAAASGWIGALVALPFASHLDVGAHQLVNLALFGITSFGLGLVLYTIGARYLHHARTALISTLDTPLAPLWVWVAFNERPALTTVVGGVIILAAVAADIVGTRLRSLSSVEAQS